MAIDWLSPDDLSFPPVEHALEDGLLAAGGDLSPERLLNAYRHGIFPWYNADNPILWWSPDPRLVLYPEHLHISKSLKKTLKKQPLTVTIDQAFTDVMLACAQPRNDAVSDGFHTWIQDDMVTSYTTLHQQGHAHSVECWLEGQLVGGLYGIAIGRVFFGESMFSLVNDSSKVAFAALCQRLIEWDIPLIDCQVYSDHLARLGATEIPRSRFIQALDTLCDQTATPMAWRQIT